MNKYTYKEHFHQIVHVQPHGFDCFVTDGFEAFSEAVSAEKLKGRKVLLINESKYGGFYLDRLSEALTGSGAELTVLELSEGSVDLNLTGALVNEKYREAGMSESDILISLGGVLSDAAARVFSYRYVPSMFYIRIPVTFIGQLLSACPLTSQTDFDPFASPALVVAEGGASGDVATAVSKRNPDLVYINILAFKNLSATDRICGLGEILRDGIGYDMQLFCYVEKLTGEKADNMFEFLLNVIMNTLRISLKNGHAETGCGGLGDAIARALERCTNYIIPHGQAVCIGTVVAANIANKRGLLKDADHIRIAKLLAAHGFTILMNFTNELIDAICASLPAAEEGFVLPEGIGKSSLYQDVSADEIRTAMNYRR